MFESGPSAFGEMVMNADSVVYNVTPEEAGIITP